MKKILAVIDAVNYREEQLDTIQYISGMFRSNLTIIMLEDVNSISPLMAPDFAEGVPGNYYEIVIKAAEEKGHIIKKNLVAIKKACRDRKINCNIRSDKGAATEEIILESRFADLLLIDKELSFPFLFDSNPTGFVKNLLVSAQCPVLVVPDNFLVPKGVIFCYNGTFSSLYAIKAFTSVFPGIVAKDCKIAYVSEKGHDDIPHEQHLREYLHCYSNHVEYKVLSGPADIVLEAYMRNNSDYIGAFGAYGRSRLSRFFDSSSAENILRNMQGPLFISHP